MNKSIFAAVIAGAMGLTMMANAQTAQKAVPTVANQHAPAAMPAAKPAPMKNNATPAPKRKMNIKRPAPVAKTPAGK